MGVGDSDLWSEFVVETFVIFYYYLAIGCNIAAETNLVVFLRSEF